MPPSAFRLNLENVRDIAADLYEEPCLRRWEPAVVAPLDVTVEDGLLKRPPSPSANLSWLKRALRKDFLAQPKSPGADPAAGLAESPAWFHPTGMKRASALPGLPPAKPRRDSLNPLPGSLLPLPTLPRVESAEMALHPTHALLLARPVRRHSQAVGQLTPSKSPTSTLSTPQSG
eukprot:EG_transcript_33273